MVDISPINGAPHGANAWGVDLNKPLDADLMKTLADALYEHRVLVIKNQTLDQDTYLNFGYWWGKPIPHVLDHMRMPGYPELLAVGNTEEKDKKVEIRNGAALWHTDQSYEAEPASATMLYSILTPRVGGQTRLADMVAATERGLLLTTLWYIRTVDPTTLLLTGLTRDGVYLIEDGEITAAVNNFRFNESPVIMLNNVEELGRPVRVPPDEVSMNIVVPPMKLRDFTFTSLSDAV